MLTWMVSFPVMATQHKKIHVQEVLLREALDLSEASRQNSKDISARNDVRHNLQLIRLHNLDAAQHQSPLL